MVILGVDPGIATIGYGVITCESGKYIALEYGAIITKPHQLLEDRLMQIFDELTNIIMRHKPDCMAIEELFFNKNVKTAVDVCQGRGVILLAARKQSIDTYEYTPLQIKSSVVGYGRAEKQQIMYMTKLLLKLEKDPKPDDTADALAVAICHANHSMNKYF
ncbi:MAG: crossover junction endodeoxyribonuclease RuvC [Clostridiales bacterium GWF2_36_10]|nr:MAG: crossover junction endodeoxyribonuclease RuvC [Clostridiales bacterium GWF2_36_10]HAN21450.1 crossover junction endodeoxyribonuclease RuvC [Clostridiales bacterium]